MTDDADKVAAEIRAQRPGRDVAHWELLAEHDPEFASHFNELIARAFSSGEGREHAALPVKTKELIAAAVLASQHNAERLPVHLRRALAEGATEREAVEAFEIALALSGIPAFRLGMLALVALRSERENA